MAGHPRWVRGLFSGADLDAIARAVAMAESRTSGEIRVHLEPRVPRGRDALGRAREVFALLGMDRTRDRNAVLLYLAIKDHKLAIVGDEGVHRLVGESYWERIRDLMVDRLRQGASRDAILDAVASIGDVLARQFPRPPDDTDQLSDEVSLGD